MSLKADTLKSNPNKLKLISKELNVILSHIDEEIKSAYDQDKTKLTVTLPITFAIANMSNTSAQRIIYYKILESLLARNYIVKIHMATEQTLLFITWLSEDEEKDIDLQNILIAKHSIQKK